MRREVKMPESRPCQVVLGAGSSTLGGVYRAALIAGELALDMAVGVPPLITFTQMGAAWYCWLRDRPRAAAVAATAPATRELVFRL